MEKRCCWYDEARWYDLAFSWEPTYELGFLAWAFETYCDRVVRTLLEPGCGSGHYLIPLRKHFRVIGFDINPAMVSLCRKKAKEADLVDPLIYRGDFSDFTLDEPVDSAYMLIDTVRHLTTARALRSHFRAMHRAVAPGGIYVLGFDMSSPNGPPPGPGCSWTISKEDRSVTTRVTCYRPPDKRRKQDFVESLMECSEGDRRFTVRSRYRQRWLTWEELQKLAAIGRDWDVTFASNLTYDTETPLDPATRSGDIVLVLKRIGGDPA